MHALAFRRNLDRDDLLEHLDSALHLRGFRRLVPEPVDERLHARHFIVLFFLALPQLLHACVALAQVAGVVARVVGERSQPDLGDPGDDGIQEEAIVRDQDHRVRIVCEVLLEPVARLEIQVVGRLVQQEQSGTAEQQLRERDAHLPAARERLAGFVEIVRREPETAEDGRDLQVDAVALLTPEGLLQFAVPRQHRGVLGLGNGVVGQPFFERRDLRAHVEQGLEGQTGFFEQRPSRVGEAVLRQVPHAEAGRLDDEPGVGLLEAGEHLQQRRLAGAVGSAQADPLAIVDLPAHRVEQHAIAEGLGQGGELDHDACSPSAFDAAARTRGTRNGLVR